MGTRPSQVMLVGVNAVVGKLSLGIMEIRLSVAGPPDMTRNFRVPLVYRLELLT